MVIIKDCVFYINFMLLLLFLNTIILRIISVKTKANEHVAQALKYLKVL